jgi:hypothetical protein
MLLRGDYPTPEALLAEAVKALVRDQERKALRLFLSRAALTTIASNSSCRKPRKVATTQK